MTKSLLRPWPPDSDEIASDKPGAVHQSLLFGVWRLLCEVTSVKVVEIGVEFEVAIGQAAMGGSLPISVSSRGGVSSAIASICM